jgi:hypothetical protein
MNTMYRMAIATLVAATLIAPAAAQVQRNFPQNALRGEIVVGTPPEIAVNGESARLAPGARIRNTRNMVEVSGGLVGQHLLVNYTVDSYGLVKDVWILRADEAAVQPWPTTREQAQRWAFDPVKQSWTQP